VVIKFVLVEPKVPKNIVAGARVIKTIGYINLVQVKICTYLYVKSKWVAYGSLEICKRILEKASYLKSDHMNLVQSICNIPEGQLISKRAIKM
jgi:tRNA C32,U32 (ribose-2'-O)-methylase TrmJ